MIRSQFRLVLALGTSAVLVVVLSAAAGATNYPFNQQDPSTAGFSTNTPTNAVRGCYFTCLSTGVSVTHLGIVIPSGMSGSRDLKLWTINGTQLGQCVTTTASASWSFYTLSTPVSLTQSTQYVVSEWGNGYYYSNTGVNTTGWGGDTNIQYHGTYYSNSQASHTFPTSILTPHIYGVADIGYTTGPGAPSSITVPASSTTGNFTVSWSSVSGATGYDLEEDTASTFANATQVYTGTATSFGVTGKGAGTYYYRVRAFDSNGPSTWTAGGNGCVVQLPPSAPASLTVPANSITGSYTVSWASSQGASGYDLEEDTSAAFTNPTVAYQGAATTTNITGKTSGTFYYRVRATSTWGNSGWTTGGNGCQIVPPGPPASITVPASSATGSYTVSWASSTSATGYDLEEDTSASFTNPSVVYTGANLSHNVTGKVSGTYYYRVRAFNQLPSTWTVGANGCAMVAPAPPASVNVPANSVTGNYQVSWAASTGAASYDLEEDTSASFTAPTTVYTGTATYVDVTGKVSGTYYYRARATNGAGISPWTAGANGCQIVPPNAPIPIVVPSTSSTGNYTVTWGSTLGATLGYELQEDTSLAFANPTTLYAGPNLSYAVFARPNGTYFYRACAKNGAGISTWAVTAAGCAVNIVPPPVPGSITVPPTSSTGSFVVSWSASAGATGYQIEEGPDAAFSTTSQVYAGPNTSASITGRQNGTYWYRVRATNTAGASSWLDSANGCRVTLASPGRPGFLTVPSTSATGTYDLSWGPVSSATVYEVHESTAPDFSGAAQVYAGPATSCRIAGRTDGSYWYRVRALNPVGTGAWRDGANPCAVTLAQAALSVDAGAANPSASLELPGATRVPMLQIAFTAGRFEAVRLQTLVVHASGSGDDAVDIVQLTLVRDVDGDGVAGGGDPIAGTGSFAADDGALSFDLSSEPTIPAGDRAIYLACADFAALAPAGMTFGLGLNPPADLSCQGDPSTTPVTPNGAAVLGGQKTLADSGVGSLTVAPGPNHPVAGVFAAPVSGLPMMQLVFSAGSMEDVRVLRLKVQTLGTGNEASGVTARLYEDADGDGQVSTADVQLGSFPFAADNDAADFTGLSVTVPAGGAVRILLAYDLGAEAAPGSYGTLLGASFDVDAVGAATAQGIAVAGGPVAGPFHSLTGAGGAGEAEAAYFMGGCAGGPSRASWTGYLLLLLAGLALVARQRRMAPTR